MENIDFYSKQHIHFIGICGISMSGLALFTSNMGIKVTGSDANNDQIIDKLREHNIEVYVGHREENIDKNCDLVVYTGAIKDDNVEIITAKNYGIPLIERSEYLGVISKNYEHIIGISGTHGKTTTTSMIALIFKNAGLNPTVHIGGICNNFDSNILIGDNKYFITEACEYKNSFRYLECETAVITSTDPDHLDSYSSVLELKRAYQNFALKSKNLILTKYSFDINKKGNVISVGINDKYNLVAKNILKDINRWSFDVWNNNTYLTNFKLNAVGKYNIENALCAIAVALEYNISIATIFDSLMQYKGVKRRHEQISSIYGVPIICDYAHHPTEIRNTITAYKDIYKKILCVFQPHTYTRTVNFMQEFKKCFKGINKLIIYKTYPAREKRIPGGDATALYNGVKLNANNKYYVSNKYQLKRVVLENIKNVDCVLVLGAGNIYNIAKNVLKSQ